TVAQDSFEEFKNRQQQAQQQAFEDEINEFKNYVAEVTSQYEAYEEQQAKEFEAFKKAVEEKWQDFKAPSKKEYVEYDDDLDSRASVDFEKGEITVEVIVEEEIPTPDPEPIKKVEKTVPKQETKQAPKQQVTQEKKKVTEPKTLKSIVEKTKASESQKEKPQQKSPEVKKKIADKKLQRKLTDILKAKGNDGKPMLNKQVVDKKGKTVTPATAKAYASELVANEPVATKTYKAKDGKKRTVYTVKVPMKSDHINTRADRYKQEILKQSKRFNIDPIIAFAVMETESAFNPKAKSHIPAYGLMQLVPKSGARDAYLYVYKKDKFIDGDYLYQPGNNIELGCAYLSKIRHKYFKSIKDDERAYICAVPAYNTGIGNVAKALVNQAKLKPASQKANSMSPDQLYKKLHKDLKHQEARDYLERVWSRKDKYHSIVVN
ncbi:MAG: murein transglycosylase domain-containing protein, partial [Candidatus Marinimicrobia bacterium]|nr:murein transglycosylase domain-containing protein [Candidatus Neomarinimicrobiota bacterium]